MIPLKLQIKNFLSYGSDLQTIDFSAYPLICLSGKNGHGKSALLDAMTWALWGQARKVSGSAKADQGLLRLGQTQMMVCLDFICNGQEYRVRREFALTYGKPYAALDFGLLNSSTENFISLTAKTIRETQEKIEQMLHLSYEAFINSAFLRQGQSNEFSKKSPRDRKDILASILGLDQYELIRKRASEKIRIAHIQKQYLMAHTANLQQELAKENELHIALQELNKKQTEITIQEEALQQQAKELHQKKESVQNQEKELQLLIYQQQQLSNQEKSLQEKLITARAHWKSVHKQKLHAFDYQTLEDNRKQFLEKIREYQQQLQDHLSCKEQLLTYKEQLAKFCSQFHDQQQKTITDKKLAVERLLVEKKYHEQQQELIQKSLTQAQLLYAQKSQELNLTKAALKMPQDFTAFEKQFEKRKEHYQQWIAQANHIKTELDNTQQKQELVNHEQAPSCPLCEQNLSAARRRFILKKFDEQTLFLQQRLKKLTYLITQLKTVLIDQHKQLENYRLHLKEHEKKIQQLAELQKIVDQAKQSELELIAQQIKIAEIITIVQATLYKEEESLTFVIKQSHDQLQKDETYIQLASLIEQTEKLLASNAYDAKSHAHANAQLTALEQQINTYTALQQQITLQENRAQEIYGYCASLKELAQEKKNILKNIDRFAELSLIKIAIHAQDAQLNQKMQDCAKEKDSIMQHRGTLHARTTTLEKVRAEYAKQQKEIATCDSTIDDYQAIALATSKDGVQALLIEDAIPEIEQEANDLLSKLTDNQTQLFIESLRDLKKGGTKETLDIKISDATGIRPYELFSGGEAFRIDFALRIAISKLLARRAGTSLQTLIIDEGFGSQDEEGLSHIMDALYKIHDDFAKIIIVSHLQSMKNQFPIHFYIQKGPNGSFIEVIEQG